MAEATDLDSETFQTLLTDALRAGPGSPEWHQAVGKLRTSGAKGADEYQLLIRAREDLESGKEYRSVRAGPGFTRNVLKAIEEEDGKGGGGISSANVIALIAAAAILAVLVVVGVILLRGGPPPAVDPVKQLQGAIFKNTVAVVDFSTGTPAGPEWKLVGEVPLKVVGKGLRPQTTQPTGADPQ